MSIGTTMKKRKSPSNTNEKRSSTLTASLSSAERERMEYLVCLGEYDNQNNYFYTTIISPENPSNCHSIKSKEPGYKINFTTILNNTPYCVAISKKESSNKVNNAVQSKLSFIKYTSETFISQENINADLNSCCYNPKNTLELILCGKGYARLWDIFINQGVLKEHQQRFLNGKIEKENNFIKAQFFEKKPCLFILGTDNYKFFVIDGFQIIHELNSYYQNVNIYELNTIIGAEENEEDSDMKKIEEMMNNIDKRDLDKKLKDFSMTLNSNKNAETIEEEEESNKEETEKEEKEEEKEESSEDIFTKLYKPKKEEETDIRLNKDSHIKYFELINDNLLLIIYQEKGIILYYKIDWNKKMVEGNTLVDNKKWNAAESRVVRVARNCKNILNYSFYKPKSELILLVDANVGTGVDKRDMIALYKLSAPGKNINARDYSQYLSGRTFFANYFEKYEISQFDWNEKKRFLYIVSKDNVFSCFDLISKEYVLRKKFTESNITSISSCQSNNLVAVTTPKYLIIKSKIQDKLEDFCRLPITEGIVQWSSKGNYIAVGGKNNDDKPSKYHPTLNMAYCLFIIDALTYQTIDVVEFTKKIVKIKFIDNDTFLFVKTEDNCVYGYYMNIINSSISFVQMLKEQKTVTKTTKGTIVEPCDVSTRHLKEVFFHRFTTSKEAVNLEVKEGKEIYDFDYDEKENLLIATQPKRGKLMLIQRKGLGNTNKKEIDSQLTCIKIVKELKVLFGGDTKGNILIYKWPFEFDFDKFKPDNLMFSVRLHEKYTTHLQISNNFETVISAGKDTNGNISIISSDLKAKLKGEGYFRNFKLFTEEIIPKSQQLIQFHKIYEMRIEEIEKKKENTKLLYDAKVKIDRIVTDNLEELRNTFKTQLENIESSYQANINELINKAKKSEDEIQNVREQKELRLMELDEKFSQSKQKMLSNYEAKLKLYQNEIERKKKELCEIRDNIEKTYDLEERKQKDLYGNIRTKYDEKFKTVKNDIENALHKLITDSTAYDSELCQIEDDYNKIISGLDTKINKLKEEADNFEKTNQEALNEEKKKSAEHTNKLQEKVAKSDQLLDNNVAIKQSVINATQRTITFQEQLLETEKNLGKIDKKLEEITSKNKHLEQIRFVLEHRMTSLEKEKAPLEGQCSFLENQKNKLTEEFNKIILQINTQNQELENKQSQLRASLIQNYEIHDQKNYVETKLCQLKKEMQLFLDMNDDTGKSYSDRKVTKVALNFRNFYDKFFSVPIDEELANYQYYAQKLQEQADKDGIANNFDLIMRNKAEEKLICEKQKVDELKLVKEKGFRRMQNENRTLISECNRLRKNLHGIYMHVIDIERRFIKLTKINPEALNAEEVGANAKKIGETKISKGQVEIVNQIKEFIRKTHEDIKKKFSNANLEKNLKFNKKQIVSYEEQKTPLSPREKSMRGLNNSSDLQSSGINKKLKENPSKNPIVDFDDIENEEGNKNKEEEAANNNGYANILQLPDIKQQSMSFLEKEEEKAPSEVKFPMIDAA
ncbi:MAG: hypothetical protein MJ252_03010 [archaeon]|nr:hypothetical protein [archaeon]